MSENLLLNLPYTRCRCCIMPEIKEKLDFDETQLCSLCQKKEMLKRSDIKSALQFDSKTPEEKKAVFLKKQNVSVLTMEIMIVQLQFPVEKTVS